MSLDLQLFTASVSRRDCAPWNICDMLFPPVALRLLHHVERITCVYGILVELSCLMSTNELAA